MSCLFFRIILISYFLFSLMSPLSEASEPTIQLLQFIDLASKNDVEVERILHERTRTSFHKEINMPSNALAVSIQNEYGLGLNGAEGTEFWFFGASKDFPETGTKIFASHEINEQEDRTENITSVGIEQSIVQNAFGIQVRKESKKLDKENQSIYLQSVEAYEDYMATIIKEFLDWRLIYLEILATKDLYNQANRFQKFLENRRKRNVARKVDVEKGILESLRYKENLVALEGSFVTQRSNIAKRSNLSYKEKFIPGEVPDFYKEKIDYEKGKEKAMETTRTLQALQNLREAGQLEISVRREDLYPEVNFLAGFNYDDSNRFGTPTDRQEIFLGFRFNWPIFDRPDRGELKKAKFDHISAILAEKEYQKNLEAALIAQIERIQLSQERLNISQKKWHLSQSIIKAERRRYERGQIDLEILILAHQDLAQNRYAYLENRIRLDKEIIEWLRLTDQLVRKGKVQLN